MELAIFKAFFAVTILASQSRGSGETSRVRRFLAPSTAGWAIETSFTLKVPVQGLGTTVSINLPFTFNLPNLARKKRSIEDVYLERDRLLESFEGFLPHIMTEVSDGHSCMLRAICEVAKAPETDEGIFGEILTHVLSPGDLLKPDVAYNQTDYTLAQWQGHFRKDCRSYEKTCSKSLFQITQSGDFEGNVTSLDTLY